jgi:ABC-2 type transport system ATP-binding protein
VAATRGAQAADAAIVVGGLIKRYGARTVVDSVSLEVRPGEVVALLGPNGAGKTTTVEIIEGYRRADGGTIRVLGTDPWRADRSQRARVGLMLQSGGFDMRARPAETVRQYASFHADPLDPDRLIDELGLATVARTPYRRLSGGERQRLAFAVALVGRPDVLILDEPTAGLDPVARAAVRELIGEARRDGRAILLTTHELTDVERIADRIAVLVAGRIVARGTVADLAARQPRLRFGLDRALDADELDRLGRTLAASVGATGEATYEVMDTAPTPALVAALAAWCDGAGRLVTWSRASGGSLEETYLELVGPSAMPEPEADR